MAFHLPRSFPNDGWIGLSVGGCSSRFAESGKDHRRRRLVDLAAGGSLGNNRLCSQRRVHMRRGSRARWNREDLLGRGGYGHVRWRGEYLGSGGPVREARQGGQISNLGTVSASTGRRNPSGFVRRISVAGKCLSMCATLMFKLS